MASCPYTEIAYKWNSHRPQFEFSVMPEPVEVEERGKIAFRKNLTLAVAIKCNNTLLSMHPEVVAIYNSSPALQTKKFMLLLLALAIYL
ncbi:hypothetical protein DSO57_1017117 [Entomophthora muscae]|uniref:Uncharacterized protein n=1 Tax=Entomophthora muscae TaxID=34485 RepID=A0ACC2UDZ3_9FUNG|nr:hypothetical protein DSO57_1017117 [Entomophthora muscae]